MKYFLLVLFLLIASRSFGQAAPGAIFSGTDILQLKPNIRMQTSGIKIMTGDADNPTVVPKSAVKGSLYIQASTSNIFKKEDNGSSINWTQVAGVNGSGTNECVARWDASPSVLQDSIFCITDVGVASGLTQFNIENLRLDGNTFSSTSGDIVLDPTGNVTLPDLTASLPLALDSSKNIIASKTNLTSGVQGLLPMANGGTNKLMTAANGAIPYSDADSFEFLAAGTSGQPLISGGAGAPTWFGSTGVIHGTSGVLSASNVVLTSEVTGILPQANGGTGISGSGTANQVFGENAAGTAGEYKTLTGTANQVTVTHGVGTVTFSTPQDIATGSTPTFAGENLSNTLTFTGSNRYVRATNSLTGLGLFGGSSTSAVMDGGADSASSSGASIHISGSGSGGDLTLAAGSGAGEVNFKTTDTLRGTVTTAGLFSWLDGITATGTITASNTSNAITSTGPLIFNATLPTIKNDTDAKELLIHSGSTAGSAGAFITLDGSSYAGTPGNVVINAGSGPGSISMKIDAAEALGINSSGLVSIGASGGTQVHNINGHATLPARGEIRFQDSSGGEYIGLKAPSSATTTTYTLPSTDGASGTVLKTNGSGVTSWVVQTAIPSFTSSEKTGSYTVTDADGLAVIVFTGSGSGSGTMTATLPTLADNLNRQLTIVNYTTGKGDVLVDGEGSETINGLTTVDLDFKGSYLTLEATATEWKIINHNITSVYKECSITTTGTNWTQASGKFMPYRESIDNNVWRLRYNIRGSLSAATTSFTLTVPNVTFGDQIQAISYVGISGMTNDYGARTNLSASTILFTLTSSDDAFSFSGDNYLASKPSCVE